MSNVTIIGAGLAGLIAAAKFPDAVVIEANESITEHKALLRFRTPDIGALTGVPFKEVNVVKDVIDFHSGAPIQRPISIQARNHYSLKVSGSLSSRSIERLDDATRYIAPDDFHAQLADKFKDRIVYGRPFSLSDIEHASGPIISTIPLPIMARTIGLSVDLPQINGDGAKPIFVRRDKINIERVDAFQTIYFPNPDVGIYRASITNGVLITESTNEWSLLTIKCMANVVAAFGLSRSHIDFDAGTITQQPRGKIVSMDKRERQSILYRLTRDFGIFSVGRFACWRNILLDDVLHDLDKVSDLINASEYDRLIRKPK